MTFKTLLLGSAAALLTVGTAQAADLAVAEPVSYVKVCDAFGSGYFYSPGSQTCIKLGGIVTFETYFYQNVGSQAANGSSPAMGNPPSDNHVFRTSYSVNFTTKSMTSFGPLTTFIDLAATTTYTGAGGANTSTVFNSRLGELGLASAYIEWGPLLFGHTASTFTYAVDTSYVATGNINNSKADLARFSWATGPIGIQLEASDWRDRADTLPTGAIPDLVAALTFKSGIFDAKVAAGYGDRVGKDTLGVMLGFGFDLSAIAKGDRLAFAAAYSDGTAEWAEYTSGGGDYAADLAPSTATAGYVLQASLKHFWTPALSTALYGRYLNRSNGPDVLGLFLTTQYDLANGLYLGGEVNYTDTSPDGTTPLTEGVSGRVRLRRTY